MIIPSSGPSKDATASTANVIDESLVIIEDIGREETPAESAQAAELRRRRLQKFLNNEQGQ